MSVNTVIVVFEFTSEPHIYLPKNLLAVIEIDCGGEFIWATDIVCIFDQIVA